MQVQSLGREDALEEKVAGHPLQYSCLENPMDGGAWWATAHGVAKESDTTERLGTALALPQPHSLTGAVAPGGVWDEAPLGESVVRTTHHRDYSWCQRNISSSILQRVRVEEKCQENQ